MIPKWDFGGNTISPSSEARVNFLKARKMKKLFLLLLITTLSANATQAAVFERDLVPGSGDGLLTFDDVNQREWLDVPQTLLARIAQETSGCSTFECVAESFLATSEFSGFEWATRADVFELAESAGIDATTVDFAINELATGTLLGLLGITLPFNNGFFDETVGGTYGFVQVVDGSPDPYIIIASTPSSSAGIASFSSFGNIDSPATLTGLFLYRNVPEPSSYLLVTFGTLAMLNVR